MLIPIWAAVAYRIAREEEALSSHFGAAWDEYAASTGRLLPRF